MEKKDSIILILVGVGIFFISIFFSASLEPTPNFIGSISKMEVVLFKGQNITMRGNKIISADGRIAFPLKYPLSLSVLLVLVGVGGLSIANEKPTSD